MEHYHITDYSFVRLSFGKSCISVVYPTPLISWKILVHTDMTKVNVVMDVQPINMQHIHDHISPFHHILQHALLDASMLASMSFYAKF